MDFVKYELYVSLAYVLGRRFSFPFAIATGHFMVYERCDIVSMIITIKEDLE